MDKQCKIVEELHERAAVANVSVKLMASILGVSRTSMYKYRSGVWPTPDDILERMKELTGQINIAIENGRLPAEPQSLEDLIREALNLQPTE